MRAEVLSLLDHHSRAGAFLSQPAAEQAIELLLDDEPLAPGAVVGAYTIVREIGRGGMGRVYLASDATLGRTVALKALAPHLLRDPAQRERLRVEARAAAALTHPGICTVYALEEIDGELYIATEFVDGHTLGEEIRAPRRPSRDEMLRTARELAAALASAHAKGIVHRDLKPENVMRGRDGRLKILDFGLARIDAAARPRPAPRMTQPGMLIGTPAYMAPEQINGLPVDARADVFAFGVLLYEYACGAHPFAGTTRAGDVARVLESDARPLGARADVPSRLADRDRALPAEGAGRSLRVGGRAGRRARRGRTPTRRRRRRTRPGGARTRSSSRCSTSPRRCIAWQIKEWVETPLTVAIFLALGATATIGGVLRGHCVFTSLMNPRALAPRTAADRAGDAPARRRSTRRCCAPTRR